jgi:hypothetical protein
MEISSFLWKKIPIPIFNHFIYPFTHRYQSTTLLEDIRHYSKTLERCHKYYSCNSNIIEEQDKEFQTWNDFIHDIGLYLNNHVPMDWGYYPFFFCIWNRSFAFQHTIQRKHIQGTKRSSFIIYLYSQQNRKTLIRLYWGLLTIEERNTFLNMFCSKIIR